MFEELTLSDLEASEAMLEQSLLSFGIDPSEWDRITLEAQFSDIHIEEL